MQRRDPIEALAAERRRTRAVVAAVLRAPPPGEAFAVVDGLAEALESLSGPARAVPAGAPVFPGEPVLEAEVSLEDALRAEAGVLAALVRGMSAATALEAFAAAARGRPLLSGVQPAMTRAFVLAHDDEADAFRAWMRRFPDDAVLVDTFDVVQGTAKLVALARASDEPARVAAVRIEQGPRDEAAFRARALLDEAGLSHVRVVVGGALSPRRVAELVDTGAPIDAFDLDVALRAAPAVEVSYELVEVDGRGKIRMRDGAPTLPSRQQVFRHEQDGAIVLDVVGRADEALEGTPLLVEAATARAARAALPEALRARPPRLPRVVVSAALQAERDRLLRA